MIFEDKLKVLAFIRPNAEFTLIGDELIWLDSKQLQPTEQEIQDGWSEYQAKIQIEEIEKEKKKLAAQTKLATLGLTIDDLKVLGLG